MVIFNSKKGKFVQNDNFSVFKCIFLQPFLVSIAIINLEKTNKHQIVTLGNCSNKPLRKNDIRQLFYFGFREGQNLPIMHGSLERDCWATGSHIVQKRKPHQGSDQRFIQFPLLGNSVVCTYC